MLLRVAAVAAVLLAGAAWAAEAPRYDVEAHCNKIAVSGGTVSKAVLSGCFKREQRAYDAVKAGWAAVPEQARAHCDKIASMGGTGSYGILKSCLDREAKAGTTPGFKY